MENLAFWAQCTTQQKTLPDNSFGRVLQILRVASLFQRAFCDFSAVSGVGCRSLRNLFAQDQGAGVAARQVQGAGLFVLAAQLFDGTAGCGQLVLAGSALHGEEIAAHLHQRQAVFGQHGQGRHGAGRRQIELLTPPFAGSFFGALLGELYAGQAQLGLTGVEFAKERAEEAARKGWREQFDLASARAVAALPMLAEYCLPLVKVGGNFLAMKGASGEDELAAARGAIKKLGGEYKETRTLHLPGGDTRTLILCKKISQTPTAYPRNGGKIAKSPLK